MELIQASPLFAGMDAVQLREVQALGVRRRVESGRVLFSEGAAATTLYVVLEGRIRVRRERGGAVVLHMVSAPDVLGCAILGGARAYPGTAEAVEDALLLAFDERSAQRMVERYPAVARNALRLLSGRVEDLRARLQAMTEVPVDGRIAAALLRLGEDGEEIRLSRRDLAELAGTTEYSASRLLAAWERAGWIRAGRQRITVADGAALRRIAGAEAARDPA